MAPKPVDGANPHLFPLTRGEGSFQFGASACFAAPGAVSER